MSYKITSGRERGSALVPALLFAITVMAFAMSVVTSGLAVNHQRRSLVAAQRAQDAAESGIHHLLGALQGPGRFRLLNERTLEGVVEGDEASDAAIRYDITIAPAGNDGCDNDLDGLADEDDEKDMYEATSTGSADRIQKTVRVTLLARYRAPNMPSAAYIEDPNADLKFSGNAFLISGQDVDGNGAKTGQLVPGIGVPGDPTGLRNQVRGNQADNVVGLGGDLSVYNVEEIDFDQLIEDAVRSANVHLEAGKVLKPYLPGDWGTIDTPAVLFGQGDIKIAGGGAGAGILVVDGNLTIAGGFEWKGLIIARGITFAGGGGGKRVMGGIVVQKDVIEEVGSKTAGFGSGDLSVNGTIDILFSQAMLEVISRAFATYTIINWREGPNPPGEAAP